MRSYWAYLLLLLIFLTHSCEKDYAFTQTHNVPPSGWTYDNILKYSFEVSDAESLYDMYLEINYLTTFAYQNVYVNVYTGQAEDKMKKTQLSLDFSNKLGIRKGDCNDENCTYLLPLQNSIFFENTGKQFFWVEQYSRTANLKGIQSIRLVGDKIGSIGDQKSTQ